MEEINKEDEKVEEFKNKLKEKGLDVSEFENIINALKEGTEERKYGLVWEDSIEEIEEELKYKTPILKEEESLRIYKGEEYTDNLLIEGDNLESLTYLKNKGERVEVIYIDPPYNSLNADGSFLYKDRRLNKGDSYKHSSWLSFMEKRLKIARDLMTEEGVMFISIDDRELYNLKLLCDEIFGEDNFVSNFVWHKKVRPSNKKVSGVSINTEYVLCYSKKGRIVFRRDELGDKGRKMYKNPDGDARGEWRTKPLWSESNNNKEKTLRLEDGELLKKKWFVSQETLDSLYKEDLVYKSRNGSIGQKIYLNDNKGTVPMNTLFSDRFKTTEHATKELKELIGDKKFDYPKPVGLMKYLINLHTNEDATILDFFSGSGTTGHAVLELNKEDGGNRNFILCTNNENNICREVTYQRLNKVINGYTTPKGKEVEGIPSNLKYYKTELVDKSKNKED